MKILYEVIVPTIFGDTLRPISKKHHQEWDKFVKKLTNGLTILAPAKGQWVNEGVEYPERVIPVRVMVEEKELNGLAFSMGYSTTLKIDKSQINQIIQFTLKHYRQRAVMFYVISNQVNIVYADAVSTGV